MLGPQTALPQGSCPEGCVFGPPKSFCSGCPWEQNGGPGMAWQQLRLASQLESWGQGPPAYVSSNCGHHRRGRRQAGVTRCPGHAVRGTASRGRARMAPASLGREPEPQPRARFTPRPAGCRAPGLTPSFREWERRSRPSLPLERKRVGRARLPGSAGARLPRGRAARLLPPGALPLCFSAAPRLPDKWP